MLPRGPITEEERRRLERQGMAQRINETRDAVTGVPSALMRNAAAAVMFPFGAQPFEGAQLPAYRIGKAEREEARREQARAQEQAMREGQARVGAAGQSGLGGVIARDAAQQALARPELTGVELLTAPGAPRPAAGVAAVGTAPNTRNMNRGPAPPVSNSDAGVGASLQQDAPLDTTEPAQRGVYNDRNMPQPPRPTSAGINFGFGDPGRGSLQDLQRSQEESARQRQINNLQYRLGIENQSFGAGMTIGETAAQRRRVAGMQAALDGMVARDAALRGQDTELETTRMTTAAGERNAQEQARATTAAAQEQARATTAAAQARAQGQLQAAQIGADATVGAAGVRAAAQVGTQANQTAQAAVAQARLQTAMALVQDAVANGLPVPQDALALLTGQLAPQNNPQLISGGVFDTPLGTYSGGVLDLFDAEQQAAINRAAGVAGAR